MSETHPGQPRRGLDPMIGIRDLAKVIGVPVATIYDWRSRGLGPVAHRFGKHVKFAAVDVEAWIASRREQPTAAPGQRRGEDAARPELRRMEPSARPPRGPDTEERALRQGKPGSASPRQAGGLR
ncbi:MAG: helix-turn-helix domain-containing protein [Bifidobacteriaceae bacterium]|jgi:predicted DNA-binding transcriptional regulator AlpA|nr:helix-turn-helix domain-containing protein [Bifidobacteriaceae bacterium]